MSKPTPSPTSSDLLLALEVRNLAMGKRMRDIEHSTGITNIDPGFEAAKQSWGKSLDHYVDITMEELRLFWRVMNGEKLDLR